MQLRAISYQWGKGRENEKFSDVYESVMAEYGHSAGFKKTFASMMLLLRYLEENIDAPPHWISTSHLDCRFYENDRVEYKLNEAVETHKLLIRHSPWNIKDNLALVVPINLGSLISIAKIKIRGGDLESSGQLIGEILRGEVTFAAIRK